MRIHAVLVAFVAAAVSAQRNYSSELDMKIDPNSVPAEDRAVWCRAQTNTCGLLCDHNTDKNSCTQSDLTFECTCAANKSMPCLQCYTQTMPTFICETLFKQCNSDNVSNLDGQRACVSDIRDLCGKFNPPHVEKDSGDDDDTSSSTTTMPSTSGSASSSAISTTSGALAAPTMGPAGNGAAAAAALGLLAYFI